MKNLVIDTSVVKKKLRRIVSCLLCNSTADFSWLLMGPDLSSVKLLWGGLSLFCLVGLKSSELLSYLSFLFQNMKAISIIGHVLNGWMSLLMLFNHTRVYQCRRKGGQVGQLHFFCASSDIWVPKSESSYCTNGPTPAARISGAENTWEKLCQFSSSGYKRTWTLEYLNGRFMLLGKSQDLLGFSVWNITLYFYSMN